MSWNILVLIICCLIAVFAVWKEYNRPVRARLVLRIIASLLAVVALTCIAISITYSKIINVGDEHSAILLTAGFVPDSLKRVENTKLLTADATIGKTYPRARLIRLEELKNDSPVITKLHVFGYGLNENELSLLDHLPIVFHPSTPPAGICAIDWNQQLKIGKTLNVHGKYNNSSFRPVKLTLKGLGTQLDSLTIAANTNKDFELTTIPKNEGRAVYQLLVTVGSDTLANENLPIEIGPVNPVKILILSASPDFETRFLKNWLSANGFSVAVRSAISKDKYSSEYVNMQPLKIDHLNSELLDKFDLIIGDLSILKSVSSAENSVLKQQVTQKGLGIIVRADSSSKTISWLQNGFPVERLAIKDPIPISLIIKGKKSKSALLKIDPAFIRFQPGTQPIVNDEKNRILVNNTLAGSGRLVFTTISNTFNWTLAGNQDDYAAFWSLLIGKSVRKTSVTEEWSVISPLPTVNEPVQLRLETSSAPGQINSTGSVIYPAQNSFIPFEWTSAYWPSTTGWHSIDQKMGRAKWWYVYGANEWQPLKASKKIAATRQYELVNHNFNNVTKAIHPKVQIEAPKIYFYLLLLVACTFLWVESKLAS
jgi:hypothetical protein